MRGTMKKVALGVLALAMAVAQAPSAMATSITGQAAIAGIDTYTATGITFINPGHVFSATASLAVMMGHDLNLTSFSFGSAAGTHLFDFDSGHGIDFNILTLTVLSNTTGTGGFLNVIGTGVLMETGFDPTDYKFSLTSTTTGNQTSYGLTLAPTSAVPEPASLLLLGSGLLGLALLLFRKARKPNATLSC